MKFICGNIDRQTFEDEKFDIVLAIGILAHVPFVERAIQKMSSFVLEGGDLIVQFTDNVNVLSRLNSYFRRIASRKQYQVNKTCYKEIVRLLRINHFSIAQVGCYSTLLPGFGMFGDRVLYQYTHFTHRTFLSKFGTDVLILAKKA